MYIEIKSSKYNFLKNFITSKVQNTLSCDRAVTAHTYSFLTLPCHLKSNPFEVSLFTVR